MIVIPGKNPMGNVLHLVAGPETELTMDIHGSQIVDITEVLNHFTQSERVYLSLARSRSEVQTAAALRNSNVPHVGTIGTPANCNGNCETCKEADGHAAAPGMIPPVAPPKRIAKKEKGKCSYCNAEKELLPVPGFKICASCAQIELGTKNPAKYSGGPNAGTAGKP